MDGNRFDSLARALWVALSRRGIMRALGAGSAALVAPFARIDADAKSKKGKRRRKKKHKKKGERCGRKRCKKSQFCCDDNRNVCCKKRGGECCNVGPGSGSCCNAPGRCGQPVFDDAAPAECCPPDRQWLTAVGLVRCCPEGTRALKGISATFGPCCPEERFCGNNNCCPDGFACTGGFCCAEANVCGNECCSKQTCRQCNGGVCEYMCGPNEFCIQGVCDDCGGPCGG